MECNRRSESISSTIRDGSRAKDLVRQWTGAGEVMVAAKQVLWGEYLLVGKLFKLGRDMPNRVLP